MKSEPLVSIGMPVFNGELRIRNALDSLVSQDYPNLEIIVSDNHSTDKTYDILVEYAHNYSKIKIVRQSRNIGAVENFRSLPKIANGDFFMWAAYDDQWKPTYVSRLVSLLKLNPKSQLAMSSWKIFVDPEDSLAHLNLKRYANLKKRQVATIYTEQNKPASFGHYMLALKMLDSNCHYYMCIYGLGRINYFRKISANMASHVGGDRIFGVEVALSTVLESCEDVLVSKYLSPVGVKTRFKNDPMFRIRDKNHFHDQLFTFWESARCLVRSQVIPFRRKLILLPLIIPIIFKNILPKALPLAVHEFGSLRTRAFRWLKRRIRLS